VKRGHSNALHGNAAWLEKSGRGHSSFQQI
jgi:hypothetical protein